VLLGRAVADLPSLPHCLDPFLKCEQRSGPAGLEGTAGSDREREGRGTDVVGHPDDDDHVMVAKRKPATLDSAAELFDGALDRLETVSGLPDQR